MATTTKGYPYPVGSDLVMEGDDAIQALAQAIDDRLPYGVAVGSGSFPETASGNGRNLTVTFPPGRFNAAPRVATNPNTSAPHNRFVAAQSSSVSSFNARYVNTGGAAGVGFTWIAIQQEGTAPAGFAAAAAPLTDEGIVTVSVACPNQECPYYDMPIDAILSFTDDEGNTVTTGGIECGQCGYSLWAPEGGDGS